MHLAQHMHDQASTCSKLPITHTSLPPDMAETFGRLLQMNTCTPACFATLARLTPCWNSFLCVDGSLHRKQEPSGWIVTYGNRPAVHQTSGDQEYQSCVDRFHSGAAKVSSRVLIAASKRPLAETLDKLELTWALALPGDDQKGRCPLTVPAASSPRVRDSKNGVAPGHGLSEQGGVVEVSLNDVRAPRLVRQILRCRGARIASHRTDLVAVLLQKSPHHAASLNPCRTRRQGLQHVLVHLRKSSPLTTELRAAATPTEANYSDGEKRKWQWEESPVAPKTVTICLPPEPEGALGETAFAPISRGDC